MHSLCNPLSSVADSGCPLVGAAGTDARPIEGDSHASLLTLLDAVASELRYQVACVGSAARTPARAGAGSSCAAGPAGTPAVDPQGPSRRPFTDHHARGRAKTIEQDSTAGGLSERRGLEMLVADEAGRNAVDHVIYDELVHGRIEERSRALYRGGSWVA